jgi:putative intracellular protease/amidase
MKKKAYVLIFDGMADWETARALCAINSSGKFDVVATGLTERPVVSMGGLTVEPNTTISDVDPEGTGILILPGGEMWERKSNERVIALIHRLHQEKVPVAAICGATLEIARAGLTLGLRHTSNSRDSLRENVPSTLRQCTKPGSSRQADWDASNSRMRSQSCWACTAPAVQMLGTTCANTASFPRTAFA